MRAAIYCRVSTDKQTTENQNRELNRVAKKMGWKISAVYSDVPDIPRSETSQTDPRSPYAESKLVMEGLLGTSLRKNGLSYAAMRFFNVYGPRQNPHGEAGVVAIFTLRLLAGGQPVINGDGKQSRDYVFVGDVAHANLAALQVDYTGSINIGMAIETDVNTLFAELCSLTQSAASEEHGPAKSGEQRRSVLAWGHAQRVLGWSPDIAIADGLRQTVEFFRARHAKQAG